MCENDFDVLMVEGVVVVSVGDWPGVSMGRGKRKSKLALRSHCDQGRDGFRL